MRKFMVICVVLGMLLSGVVAVEAAIVNGANAELDMDVTITLSNGAVLTFVQGHGANAGYAYVYTDVGGTVEEDEDGENGWNDWLSYSASANTSDGAANGSVTVNTAGFDYSIHADALVQGLAIGDYGLGMGYAYAWPDWLRTDAAGTATITIEYTYTLDTQDTCDDAEAYVFMNAFFADHAGTNYLTDNGWPVDWGSNPDTSVAEYSRSIAAGDSVTVTDSVSWDIQIPHTGEPYSWWSLWAYGEVGVEVAPVPEPTTLGLLLVGGLVLLRRKHVELD